MTETLQKITLQYDLTQDRMRLTGLMGDNKTVNIWLTQRYLGLLIKQMLAWLDRAKTVEIKNEARSSSVKQIMQEFAQGAAVSTQKPEQPVIARAESVSLLPNGFDVTLGARAITVAFREDTANPDSPSYRVTFEEVVLRRWLQGLCGLYKTANWPTGVWPEWILDATTSTDQTEKSVRH